MENDGRLPTEHPQNDGSKKCRRLRPTNDVRAPALEQHMARYAVESEEPSNKAGSRKIARWNDFVDRESEQAFPRNALSLPR